MACEVVLQRHSLPSRPGGIMGVARLASRSAVVGALIGLAIGVLEAARLYFIPLEPLLAPDVRYVIWFVAPLVDLAVGALLGFVVGLFAGALCRAPRAIAKLSAAGLGAAATFLICFVVRMISPLRAGRLDPTTSWCVFMAVFVPVLLACYHRLSDRFRRLFGDEQEPSLRPIAVALLVSVAVLVLGVGVFEFQHLLRPRSVRASSTPSADKPNIVLITLDTVRADHLSLYGYARPTSPNLDRWARQGVVFDNAIAPSSWTLASHASVLTGLLPHQHGANWFSPVDTGRWTLAEVLRAYGYETAGFASNVYYGQAGWGNGQGFQVYEDASASAWFNLQQIWAGGRLLQPLYYKLVRPGPFDRIRAEEVNHDLFGWYQQRSGRPFFLFVNYFDVHEPHIAPAPYDRRFGQISRAAIEQVDRRMDSDTTPTSVERQVSKQERQSLIDGYDNCLAYLDDEVGRFLQFLSSQPEWSNTVVIITSDHGQSLGEHDSYGHGLNLYRQVIHVPLIVLGPGIPRGLRVSHTVGTRTLFATVLDMTLGIRQPFYNNSLRRFWEPDFTPGPYDDMVISELAPRRSDLEGYVSLTTPGWQYVLDSQGHKELYRWIDDPDESVNEAQSYPEQARVLDTRLRDRIGSSLGPWVEPQYLSALVPGGSPPTRTTAFGLKSDLNPAGLLNRVGVSQAYFPSRSASNAAQPGVSDQELLESLPYH